MAKGKALSDEMEKSLTSAGIMCRQKPVYKKTPEADNYYELLVLPSEAEAANEILFEKGI
jgi:hypothetical protein